MPLTWAQAPLAELIAHAFPSCSDASLSALEQAADVRGFRADEVIAHQGGPSFVGIVAEGYLALWRVANDGRKLLVGLARSGEIAALTGLADLPIPGDLVALMPCRVVMWTGQVVRTLAQRDGGLALDTFDDAMRYATGLMGRMEDLHTQNAQRRVARVLYEYRELFFGPAALLTMRHLPGIVGTSREMTGRVVRELASLGLISRSIGGRLTLLDQSRLRTVAMPSGHPGDA